VISRRSLLVAPAAFGFAQPRAPDILVVWIGSRTVPERIARESVVFPRAYAACPEPALARRALETGKFPHAFRPGDDTLSFRQLNARTDGDAVRMAATVGPATIVVVTAAGGDEDSPRERFIRVPLAIRYPGILIPRNLPEILISHADLMPTLLALAGARVPSGIQGRDLSRRISGRGGDVPDSVYVQGRLRHPDEWRVVVRGFDKIILTPEEQVLGLFNLADDPDEKNDLSRDSAHELTRDAMLALARTWMRRLGDGWDPSGLRLRR
jgi:arylsulfatase A-like enzyme